MKTLIKIITVGLIVAATTALSFAREEGQRSRTFQVQKGGSLQVSVSFGDIQLRTSEKNEVAIRVVGLDDEELDRVKMTQNGNDVRVEFRARGSHNGGDATFEVDIPDAYNVKLSTSGGDLSLSGTLTGRFEGSTAGGDVKLGSIINGPLNVSTSGGDITVDKLHGDGDLGTSGGNIRVGGVSGELDVRTSGGDIRVDNVGKSLDAKTSGGDIEIGDVGGEAKVSTAGGDIRVGKVSGRASMSTAGGNIDLQGASGDVNARTAGGDIRLKGVTGTIDAKTAGGDVEGELIPSGKGGSRLATAGGKVKLSVPENSKVTIEATIEIEGWGRKSERYVVRSEFKQESYVTEDDEIRAVYKLNGGGDVIEVKTVNSDIELKKLR
jgi:DUF4097 and DUF4098 domain-containing protein YvlB